jgi:hypothetical protein
MNLILMKQIFIYRVFFFIELEDISIYNNSEMSISYSDDEKDDKAIYIDIYYSSLKKNVPNLIKESINRLTIHNIKHIILEENKEFSKLNKRGWIARNKDDVYQTIFKWKIKAFCN